MKIAYVTLAGTPAGGVRIIAEHLNRLASRGHETTLLLLRPTKITWMPTQFNQMTLNECIPNKYDIVVATEINTWPIVANEPAFGKAVRACFVQMMEHLFFATDSEAYNRFIQYLSLPLRYFTISHWLRNELKERHPNQEIPIIPNAVNKLMFYPDRTIDMDKPRKFRILVATNFGNYAKDIEAMAWRAALQAKFTYGNIAIWGFGLTPPPFPYDKYWQNPTQDQIRQIYSSSDVVLAATRFEGSSCTDLEAMACGTALCRALHTGKYHLKHGENCLLSEYGNFKNYVDNLFTLIEDRQYREKIANGGLEYVRNLDWDKSIDLLERFFLSEVKRGLG